MKKPRPAVSIVGIGDDGCSGLTSRAFNAVARAQGRLAFLTDLHIAGALHGVALRSPHGHARLVALDLTRWPRFDRSASSVLLPSDHHCRGKSCESRCINA